MKNKIIGNVGYNKIPITIDDYMSLLTERNNLEKDLASWQKEAMRLHTKLEHIEYILDNSRNIDDIRKVIDNNE